MTRPTAVIAEDELPQRQELRALLHDLWPELDVVAECADGLAALDALEQHRPQVAFLDIRMPGVSGLEVARAAGEHCQVIFITAYEEYALRAFDEGAVDYLQKPVSRDRLKLAVERTRTRLGNGTQVDMAALIDLVQARLGPGGKQGIKWITASVGNSMKMFSIDEVLFFQAQDKYTRVVTAESEGHIRTPLKELLGAGLGNLLAGASQRDRARRCDPRGGEGRGWQAAPHHPRPRGSAARQQRFSVPLPRHVNGDIPHFVVTIGLTAMAGALVRVACLGNANANGAARGAARQVLSGEHSQDLQRAATHYPRSPPDCYNEMRNVPIYSTAMGRPGEPVAPFRRSGVNTNMNR